MAVATPASLPLLDAWLQRRLDPEAHAWLSEKRRNLQEDRQCFLAFALAPRRVGKDDLHLDDRERAAAAHLYPGWEPRGWTLDQVARITLLLAGPPDRFRHRLDQLCATGDLGELVTLYQALPLYPSPQELVPRATEGLRTNIITVFEAVAHHNPFPHTFFDQAAWNQMVLKALFVGSRLHPIQGLDVRANEDLAQTLIDYAHERWAAHRAVTPELWRCLGPFLTEARLPDLRRAWESDDLLTHQAAGLALAAAPLPHARDLLQSDPGLTAAIESGEITWATIHHQLSQRPSQS